MAKNTNVKSTMELQDILAKEKNVEQYLANEQENLVRKPLHKLLMDLCYEKNIHTATVLRDSNLHKSYFYEIMNGKKNPSRDKLLAILFALKCNTEEFNRILKQGGYSVIYVRDPRNACIFYSIEHGYTLDETNLTLMENGLPIIE